MQVGQQRYGWGVAVGDYDRDGWTDILTSEWQNGENARLLRNRGLGFVEAGRELMRQCSDQGVSFDQIVVATGSGGAGGSGRRTPLGWPVVPEV